MAAWSSGWDDTQLATKYGQTIAARMSREPGCTGLKRADSIMRFDRPALLTGGTDDLKGGSQIDDEARGLLSSLYPPFRDILHITLKATEMPGFGRRDHSKNQTSGCGRKTLYTPYTSNALTGLCTLHIDQDENFRVTSGIMGTKSGSSIEVEQGSWSWTYLYDSHMQVLGFAESDKRIQTGSVSIWDLFGRNNEVIPFKYIWPVTFSRPFRTTPSLTAWIAGFDSIKNKWIRIKILTLDVTTKNFQLYAEAWHGKHPSSNAQIIFHADR